MSKARENKQNADAPAEIVGGKAPDKKPPSYQQKQLEHQEKIQQANYPHVHFPPPQGESRNFLSMFLEGTQLFSTQLPGLNRLRGQPITIRDYFFSPFQVLTSIAIFAYAIYILARCLAWHGTLKSQWTVLNTTGRFEFSAESQMAMLLQNQFWLDRLLPLVAAHQEKLVLNNRQISLDDNVVPPCTMEDQEADNCFEQFEGIVPLEWDDLTVDDRAYVEKFICDRSVFYYREYEKAQEDVLDAGAEGSTRHLVYKARCKMNAWANDRVRVNYFLGVGDEPGNFVGYEYTTTTDPATSVDYFSVWDPAHVDGEVFEQTKYHFKADPAFHSYYAMDFKPTLDGLTLRSLMFNSGNATDPEVYYNWAFPTPFIWDQYWYDPGNTLMFIGVPQEVGASNYGTITIRALPQVTVMRDEIPDLDAGDFGEMRNARCIYARTNEQNIDGKVELVQGYDLEADGRAVYLRVDFDFTQRFFVLENVNRFDVAVAIGGSFAFFVPVLMLASPFVLGYFLYQMALVIQEEYEYHHRKALVNLLRILVAKIRTRRKVDSRYILINKICNKTFFQMKQWVKMMEGDLRKASRSKDQDPDAENQNVEDAPPLSGVKEENLKPQKLRIYIDKFMDMLRINYNDCITQLHTDASNSELDRQISAKAYEENLVTLEQMFVGANEDLRTRQQEAQLSVHPDYFEELLQHDSQLSQTAGFETYRRYVETPARIDSIAAEAWASDAKEAIQLRNVHSLPWCQQPDRAKESDLSYEFHFDKQSIIELLRAEVMDIERTYFEHMERIKTVLEPLAQASVAEILRVLRNRVSIYGIFRLFDSVELCRAELRNMRATEQHQIQALSDEVRLMRAYLLEKHQQQKEKKEAH